MLNKEIIALGMWEGASLVGFAPVDRFMGAPRGHHPCDFIATATTVISTGMMVPRAILDYETYLVDSELIPPEIREEYLQQYFYNACGYSTINHALNRLGYRITQHLERMGFRAVYFTPSYDDNYAKYQQLVPGQKGIFSHRHAAVRAGLGEFGLNNLVVTPQFGPRVRFNSIITDAPLKGDPLLSKKVCLDLECKKCIQECRTGALKIEGAAAELSCGPGRPARLDPVSMTDVPRCKNKRVEAFCSGLCIRVCPVGRPGERRSEDMI